jgi:hypothetical protein
VCIYIQLYKIPYQGASIKDYDDRTASFCNSGDDIYTGNFEIVESYVSYGIELTVTIANADLKETVNEDSD